MTEQQVELCVASGQDPTLRNDMPMMAIEQSEYELKRRLSKGTTNAGTSTKTKRVNTRRNT